MAFCRQKAFYGLVFLLRSLAVRALLVMLLSVKGGVEDGV